MFCCSFAGYLSSLSMDTTADEDPTPRQSTNYQNQNFSSQTYHQPPAENYNQPATESQIPTTYNNDGHHPVSYATNANQNYQSVSANDPTYHVPQAYGRHPEVIGHQCGDEQALGQYALTDYHQESASQQYQTSQFANPTQLTENQRMIHSIPPQQPYQVPHQYSHQRTPETEGYASVMQTGSNEPTILKQSPRRIRDCSRMPQSFSEPSLQSMDRSSAQPPESPSRTVARKPPRPERDFIERNKNRARGVSSAKSGYSARLRQKQQEEEERKVWAPGMVLPRKKAASADNAVRSHKKISPRELEPLVAQGWQENNCNPQSVWEQRSQQLAIAKGQGHPMKQSQQLSRSESRLTERRVKVDVNLNVREPSQLPGRMNLIGPIPKSSSTGQMSNVGPLQDSPRQSDRLAGPVQPHYQQTGPVQQQYYQHAGPIQQQYPHSGPVQQSHHPPRPVHGNRQQPEQTDNVAAYSKPLTRGEQQLNTSQKSAPRYSGGFMYTDEELEQQIKESYNVIYKSNANSTSRWNAGDQDEVCIT